MLLIGGCKLMQGMRNGDRWRTIGNTPNRANLIAPFHPTTPEGLIPFAIGDRMVSTLDGINALKNHFIGMHMPMKEDAMPRSMATHARASRWSIVPSTLRLALWRLRQTWRLLLGAGLGIVVAVMLVCAVPMFSHVATTAGLRSEFAAPASNVITVNAATTDLEFQNIQQIARMVDYSVQTKLGHDLIPGKQFSMELPTFPVISTASGAVRSASHNAELQVVGYDEDQLASHAKLIAGRFPQAGATIVEVDLTKATADALGVTVGSTILLNSANIPDLVTAAEKVPITVVGIVAVDQNEIFFHHLILEPQHLEFPPGENFYRVFAGNDDLLQLLQTPSAAGALGNRTTTQFFWYYSFDQSRLDSGTLDALSAQANALQVELPNTLLGLDGAPTGSVYGDAYLTLADFQLRMRTLQVPITFVLLLVLAFVLYFVSVMAEIVVDRQADAIAILRSRGVSRLQIFGALVTQSLVLGVLALAVGPVLALETVVVLARFTLTPANQSALQLITTNPLQAAYALPWSVLVVVVAALGAMIVAINRAASVDVLALRREASRTTRKPFWQRLNLDVVAASIAVTGYLIYALVLNRVSPALQFQLGFLGLVAPSFVLLAGTLLFFRIYPTLLRLGAWIAGRGKGSTAMLALAQMSRSPRQAMRTTFLLGFATAFMIFAMIFAASQTQHLSEVASYTAGADFSGVIPGPTDQFATLSDQMSPYRHIPGVTSVALGYVVTLPAGIVAYNQQLMAVDADHFAQTATWDAGNSTQSLGSLMAHLVSQRAAAASNDIVPAMLNGSLWDALHLSPGTDFSLVVPGYGDGKMRFVAMERVEHIQGIYDSAQFFSGGIMVDYQTYVGVFAKHSQTPPSQPNFMWLRTADDAASLAQVRNALTIGKLQLASLVDRRALTQVLITDPLQVDLSGVLTVGAIAAIILALVGVLTASWLNARSRLTNFAVLRALGAAPGQIAGVLVWEQSIVDGVALLLGVLLGILLSVMLLPALVFVNARTQGGDLLGAANVPAIQPIAPVGALALTMGALAVICVGAVVLMTVVVARPSVSATLRLNED